MTFFNWSTTAADNDDADSTINAREGWSPRVVNNAVRALMAAMAKYREDISGNLVTGGTSTAYTVTTNQTYTSLIDGITVTCRMSATSGASPTLNVDSLGAKPIALLYGTAIPTGALLSGTVQKFTYDSTDDKWIVQGHLVVTQELANGGTGAALTDPGDDRVLFWDDSAGAMTWLDLGTGLAISGTDLSLSFLGIEALTDPNVDALLMWDDSAGATAFGTFGNGIETSGTTIQANIASKAEMETATATDVLVPIGRQHNHPGHPKAWVNFNGSGTVAINSDYGVSSITDDGTGLYTLHFDTAFSSTGAYGCVGGWGRDTDSAGDVIVGAAVSSTKSTSALQITVNSASASKFDSTEVCVILAGDQ